MEYSRIKRFRLVTISKILTQLVNISDRISLVESDLVCDEPRRTSLRLGNANQALYEVQELARMLIYVGDELLEHIKELKAIIKHKGH